MMTLPAFLSSPGLRALLLAAAIPVLGACAASTQLVQNDKASDEIKARSYKSYKEILLIPPKEDPRNVVPRTVSELESMGFKVQVIEAGKPIDASQGTGFVISASGYLVTCAHVVGDAKEATVTLNGTRHFADVVKADKDADIALLKLRDALAEPVVVASFRPTTRGYGMGEDVFTIGYPLSRLLGNGERMTRGLVSATTGMRDEPRHLQVSAEIQPGNSGGPLLDREGFVIGIIQETINPWRVVQASGGALPQNINFALKSEPVLDFIKSASPEVYQGLQYDKAVGIEAAGKAVAKVQAGIVADDTEAHGRMVVRLAYLSMWDIWYRFRFFILTAFDFETQEPLFAAGQGRDNLVSNEEVVMKDTFDQFRRAISSR